jgi:hypothetical protein
MTINIRRQLRRYVPILLEARKGNLNEADTVVRVCRFFEEVLAYDAFSDVSRETQLKDKYVDAAIKIDGRVQLLVEVKAADKVLRERHIEQAQHYASENNYRWVLLTNGVEWQLYHLTFEEGIEYERVFSVTLEGEAFDEAADQLAVLHKTSVRRGLLEKFWEARLALAAGSIGRALFCDSVIGLLRREIRRQTGVLIDPEDLAKSLHALLSSEAREQIGPARVRKRRRRLKAVSSPPTGTVPPPGAAPT